MGRTARLIPVASIAALGCGLSAGSASATVSSLTVNPKAQLSADRNVAAVSGTITCDPGHSGFVNVNLTQTEGRVVIIENGAASVACTGAAQPWTVSVSFFGTQLLPGRAGVNVVGTDFTDFSAIGVHSTVILSP
jgi:Family of unknown function (DUF6299)